MLYEMCTYTYLLYDFFSGQYIFIFSEELRTQISGVKAKCMLKKYSTKRLYLISLTSIAHNYCLTVYIKKLGHKLTSDDNKPLCRKAH